MRHDLQWDIEGASKFGEGPRCAGVRHRRRRIKAIPPGNGDANDFDMPSHDVAVGPVVDVARVMLDEQLLDLMFGEPVRAPPAHDLECRSLDTHADHQRGRRAGPPGAEREQGRDARSSRLARRLRRADRSIDPGPSRCRRLDQRCARPVRWPVRPRSSSPHDTSLDVESPHSTRLLGAAELRSSGDEADPETAALHTITPTPAHDSRSSAGATGRSAILGL